MRAYTWTAVAAAAFLGSLATTPPAEALGGANTASLEGTTVQGSAAGRVKSVTLALGGSNTPSLQGAAAGNTRTNFGFKIKSVTLPTSNPHDRRATPELRGEPR
jgi:hypothetical protein